ncbi:MAG TPA: hypothetical protein VK462_04640 [Nitrososphaeraceae archaeon]|nr:hypothetical protein [Nitrososphaeraceae archaeon]
MVTILQRTEKRSPWGAIGAGLGKGLGEGLEIGEEKREREKQKKEANQVRQQENEFAKRELDLDLSGVNDPKIRQELAKQAYQAKISPQLQKDKYAARMNALNESPFSKYLGNDQGQGLNDQGNQSNIPRAEGRNDQGEIEVGNVKVPSMVPEKAIFQAESVGEHGLAQQFREHNKQILENERHQQSLQQKQIQASRKETMPLRKQYADQAKYAKDAQQNKKQQINLIKRGKIDTPERVFFASLLPGALGNKMLSSDTQLYRAGLFEEFGVLKAMFPGSIRVKEIELLEDKLATLEKSHEAKEKILDTGIKKLEIPKIKAKAAQRVEKEHPKATLLDFEELVDKYSKDDLDKAYNDISDSYNKIYFEYAPEKSSLIDKDGNVYKDIPKNLLESFYKEGEKEGLELRPI